MVIVDIECRVSKRNCCQQVLPVGVAVGIGLCDGAVFGGGQEVARRVDWAGSAGLPLSDSFPPDKNVVRQTV